MARQRAISLTDLDVVEGRNGLDWLTTAEVSALIYQILEAEGLVLAGLLLQENGDFLLQENNDKLIL